MLENFIYAKEKSLFEEALSNGEVLDEAIVFIEDTKEIWNHGTYFGGSKVDLSNIETSILNILNNKLNNISDLEVIRSGAALGATSVLPSDLANIAKTGSYDDLINKPTIPSAVTESTVSGWGYTKNIGTITGVSVNGTSVSTSGVANIPAASTSAYGVTKLSSSTSSTSTTLAATASAVKSAYDLARGKQDILVSGSTIKTINGESILGYGNIVINSSSEETTINNGVYAVDADGKLIDYNIADSTATGVALVAGEHKFMIAKSDATNDGSNYNLFWTNNTSDLSLTNYTKSDGTNGGGCLPKPDGTFGGTIHLSGDFTTWGNGALSDFNGKANTAVIAAASSHAKDMCTVLNTFNASDSFKDWYVPACGQLALMYLNMTEINAALAKIGGTALAAENFWSSSEYSSDYAWYVSFYNGGVGNYFKDSAILRVRFVRDISVKSLKERVSELESSKQDTLISGTSIKTINGESILGSGDIEISGGSSSGGSGAYPEVNHGSNPVGIITPNVFHVYEDPSYIGFVLGDEQEGVVNEYIFQISFHYVPEPATFPDTIQWANGEPFFKKGKTYQISIVNNIGLIVSV